MMKIGAIFAFAASADALSLKSSSHHKDPVHQAAKVVEGVAKEVEENFP